MRANPWKCYQSIRFIHNIETNGHFPKHSFGQTTPGGWRTLSIPQPIYSFLSSDLSSGTCNRLLHILFHGLKCSNVLLCISVQLERFLLIRIRGIVNYAMAHQVTSVCAFLKQWKEIMRAITSGEAQDQISVIYPYWRNLHLVYTEEKKKNKGILQLEYIFSGILFK